MNMISKATLLTALLSVASATPTPHLARRWEDGVDCTQYNVGAPPGLLFAFETGNGNNQPCDIVGGLKSADGFRCYITNSDEQSLGDSAKCPSDPAPNKNPDGSDAATIADGFIDSWCSAAGGGVAVGIANTVGCLIFGFYESNGDPAREAVSGAVGICDTIFAGACTWFTSVAPEIAAGMSRPCTDDPGSNACAFANPGKL